MRCKFCFADEESSNCTKTFDHQYDIDFITGSIHDFITYILIGAHRTFFVPGCYRYIIVYGRYAAAIKEKKYG